MKKLLFAVAVLVPLVALASAIKTWSSGETVTATDLNATFVHLHNTMVGGHGARLVDADVSASAAIAHSKLATPALVPKAWVQVYDATPCDGSTAADCAEVAGSGITSVVGSGTAEGLYTVNITTTRADGFYAVLVTAQTTGISCNSESHLTNTLVVRCRDLANTATDANFSLLLMDNL